MAILPAINSSAFDLEVLKKVKVKRIPAGGKSPGKNARTITELVHSFKTNEDFDDDPASTISGKVAMREAVCSIEKQGQSDERISKDKLTSSEIFVKTSARTCSSKIRLNSIKPVGKKSQVSDLENRKTSKRNNESALRRRNRKVEDATKFPSDCHDNLPANEAVSKRENSTKNFSENCPSDIVTPYMPSTESNTTIDNSIPSSTLAIPTFGLCNVLVPAFSLMPFDAHKKKLSNVKPLLAYLPASSLNPTSGAKESGETFRILPARPLIFLPGPGQLAFGLPIVRPTFHAGDIKQETPEKIDDSSSKLAGDLEDLSTAKPESDDEICSSDQSGISMISSNAERSSGVHKDIVQSYPKIKEEKVDVKSKLECITMPIGHRFSEKPDSLKKTKTAGLTVKLEKDGIHDHDQETMDKTKALTGQAPDQQVRSFIGHVCHSSLHPFCGSSLGSSRSCPPNDCHLAARTSLTATKDEKSPLEGRAGSPCAETARDLMPLGPGQEEKGVRCDDKSSQFLSSACTERASATTAQEDMSNCSPIANEEHSLGNSERGWYDEGMVSSPGIRLKESHERRRYRPFLDCHLPPKKRKYVDENAESSAQSKNFNAEDLPCRSSYYSLEGEENRVPGRGNSIHFPTSEEAQDLKVAAIENDVSRMHGNPVPELVATSGGQMISS